MGQEVGHKEPLFRKAPVSKRFVRIVAERVEFEPTITVARTPRFDGSNTPSRQDQYAFSCNRRTVPAEANSIQLHILGADEGNAHHVGRARRAERHARNDDHALAGLGKALVKGDAAGAAHHRVDVARVLRNNAMDAPHKGQAPRRGEIWRKRDRRRFGPLARDAQAGSA